MFPFKKTNKSNLHLNGKCFEPENFYSSPPSFGAYIFTYRKSGSFPSLKALLPVMDKIMNNWLIPPVHMGSELISYSENDFLLPCVGI